MSRFRGCPYLQTATAAVLVNNTDVGRFYACTEEWVDVCVLEIPKLQKSTERKRKPVKAVVSNTMRKFGLKLFPTNSF